MTSSIIQQTKKLPRATAKEKDGSSPQSIAEAVFIEIEQCQVIESIVRRRSGHVSINSISELLESTANAVMSDNFRDMLISWEVEHVFARYWPEKVQEVERKSQELAARIRPHSRVEKSRARHTQKLYVIECMVTGVFKVGISVDAARRLIQLQTGYPHPLSIRSVIGCRDARGREREIHGALSAYRLSGEWFSREAVPKLDALLGRVDRQQYLGEQEGL
jgi:hypothetical protein